MIYGWTSTECLKIPARRFFSLLKAGKELEYKRNSKNYAELCRISFIAIANERYRNDLIALYSGRVTEENYQRPAMPSGDPNTAKMLAFMIRKGGA